MTRMYELVDTESEETCGIQPMDSAEAADRNAGFRHLGEPYRWIPHQDVWLNPEITFCKELLPEEGAAGVVIRDFRAG